MTTFGEQLDHWKNPRWWYAIITVPWLLGLVLLAQQARRYRTIASREQTTFGTITGHDPNNHNSYQYTFSAGGRSFRAWQVPHRNEWHIGEQVVVYYDPMDPAVSSLIDFTERSYDDEGPIPLLLVGIVGVAAFIYYQRRRSSRAISTN